MSKETILIVEDETLVGLELKEDLERLGVLRARGDRVRRGGRARRGAASAGSRPHGRCACGGASTASRPPSRPRPNSTYPSSTLRPTPMRRPCAARPRRAPTAFLLKPFDERELAANIAIALARAKGDENAHRELRGAVSLIDALDEAVIIADLEGRVVHANRAAALLLGMSDSSRPRSRTELSARPRPAAPLALRARSPRSSRFGRAGTGAATAASSSSAPWSVARGRILENSAAEANATLLGLLPLSDAAGPGYRVGGFLDPCLSGSGDFFDAFPAGPGTTAFYSLDVMAPRPRRLAHWPLSSLHDLLPGLGRGYLGSAAPAPPSCCARLYARYYAKREAEKGGRLFHDSLRDHRSSATGEYAIARGGYTPVLHSRKGREAAHIHNTKGAAVGVMSDAEVEEARGVLASGDRLLLVSDGLLGAFGGEGFVSESLERLSAFAPPPPGLEPRGASWRLSGSALREFAVGRSLRGRLEPPRDRAPLTVVPAVPFPPRPRYNCQARGGGSHGRPA